MGREHDLKVVVIFEGRDAAGKGGVIKRITESLNPRICRVVALGRPTERERTSWYFQRYAEHLPSAGEMVLFDRSWYNRAGVEHVMGFCTEAEYWEFLRSCPEFEQMLIRSGIILVKYWFSVSDAEQERRFQGRMGDPTRSWKLSPMDIESRAKWVEYSKAKDAMFAHTDTKQSPWRVVKADNKKCARLNCMRHLLSIIPYEDLTPSPRPNCRRARTAVRTTSAPRSKTRRSCPRFIDEGEPARVDRIPLPSDGGRGPRVNKFIIMGIQGCGKGTQAKLLAKDFDLVHISVGDIFRWHIQSHTKLAARIGRCTAAGELVADDIVEEIVRSRLDQHDWNYGFILDGFPRNRPQAEFFLESYDIDGVIQIDLPDEVVFDRVLNRRLCSKCGLDYNLIFHRPTNPDTL